MKRTVLLAVVVLMTICSSASNAATPARVAFKCSISKVTLSKSGVVSATGKCVELKSQTNKQLKNLPVSWTHQLIAVRDQLGYACHLPAKQTAVKTGKSFKLVPASVYTATVKFKITSRKAAGRPSKSFSKTVTLKPHGNGLSCAKLGTDVPPLPVDQMCPWRDPITEANTAAACSLPAPGAVGFVTPVTMSGNTVSAGYVAGPSGNCTPVVMPQTVTWFGSPVPSAYLKCLDGSIAYMGAWDINLTGPNGETCSAQAQQLFARAFTVPSSWGGELRVTFVMHSFDSSGHSIGQKYYESGIFRLGGSADGCPQLQLSNP